MNTVLSATGPIFLVILIGFLAVRLRALSAGQLQGMGVFVMRIALPALIVQTFMQRPMREIVDLRFLVVYGAAALTMLIGAFLTYRFVLRVPTSESAVRALGMASPNSGYVGFPIALQLVGPAAGVGLALCMLVENILVIPGALALAEAGWSGGGSIRSVLATTARRLIRTPLILSIAIGFGISMLEMRLPDVVTRTLALLAGASAPLALVVLGGSLNGLPFRSVAGPAIPIVIGKLLFMPLTAFGLLQLVPLPDPDLRRALLIYSASPMLSIYTVIGQRFSLGELTATTLLIATIASFFTISGLLLLLH